MMVLETRIENNSKHPSGIGGWLIVLMIVIVVTMLLTAKNIVQGINDFRQIDLGAFFDLMPGLAVLSIFSIIFGVSIILFSFYCLTLIIKKNAKAPGLVMWLFILIAVIGTIEGGALYYFAQQLDDPSLSENEPRDTIKAWVSCVLWVGYLLTSKRVANTFGAEG